MAFQKPSGDTYRVLFDPTLNTATSNSRYHAIRWEGLPYPPIAQEIIEHREENPCKVHFKIPAAGLLNQHDMHHSQRYLSEIPPQRARLQMKHASHEFERFREPPTLERSTTNAPRNAPRNALKDRSEIIKQWKSNCAQGPPCSPTCSSVPSLL